MHFTCGEPYGIAQMPKEDMLDVNKVGVKSIQIARGVKRQQLCGATTRESTTETKKQIWLFVFLAMIITIKAGMSCRRERE